MWFKRDVILLLHQRTLGVENTPPPESACTWDSLLSVKSPAKFRSPQCRYLLWLCPQTRKLFVFPPSPTEKFMHIKHNGQSFGKDLWQQRDENTDARTWRCRQNNHPLQAEAGAVRHHHPHRRLQRGDGHLQECQVQRVGCGRPRQDQATLETLLHRHPGPDFRSGLCRQGQDRRGPAGAPPDHQWPRDEGHHHPGLRQQTRPDRRNEAPRDPGEAGPHQDPR